MEVLNVVIPKPPEPTATVVLTKQEIRLIRKALMLVPYNRLDDVDANIDDLRFLLEAFRGVEGRI